METMEIQRVLVGGPRDGWTSPGVPYPQLKTVEIDGVATYVRPPLRDVAGPVEYHFDSIEPHSEPLATSMRLFAQGIAPPLS
jgi:hypothetical protein